MKLRNRKTEEVIELLAKPSFVKRNDDYLQSEVNTFNSLAELNAEWEDCEEPKEYWCIDWTGGVNHIIPLDDSTDEYTKNKKEIGNYFETREEAEKAVEKLKAWKRLKDKGFRFIPEASYVDEQPKETGESMMLIACTMKDYRDFVFGDNADIKLLFGGEE